MSKKAEIYKEIAKKYEELAALEVDNGSEATAEVALDDMDFKALKALAKKMGLNAKGTREQLIEAIRNAENGDNEEQEEAPSKKSKSGKAPKASKKKQEVEEDDEEEESDEIRAKVEAAAEGMSDKELKEFCKEAGISTKGGREAMLTKIEEAVRNGDLDESIFDDEEEEEDDDTDTETEEDEEEDSDSDDDEESEEEEDDSDDDDSEEEDEEEDSDPIVDREEVAKFAKTAKTQFKKGKLKIDAIKAFLKKAGVSVSKKMKPDEVLDLYISTKAYFIDDEGDEHEPGDAYMLNEEPYCCGKPLEVKKQKGKHVGICSVCGEKYPLDEE